MNRSEALSKLRSLIADSLVEPVKRKRTRPSRTAVEKRLRRKRMRALTKSLRRKADLE